MKKLFLISVAIFAMIVAGCAPRANTQVSGTSTAQGAGGSASGGNDTFGGVDSLAGCSPDLLRYIAQENGAPAVRFDFDSSKLPAGLSKCLESIAQTIKTQVDTGVKLTVAGHCDEWGSDEYNQALGLRRAASFKRALVNLGVKSSGVTTKSYGESQPYCTSGSGDKGECDFSNRRAVVGVGL